MKIKELISLSEEELRQKERELREEWFHLRVQKQSGQLEKPSRLKEIRRTIARIQTILSAKRLEKSAEKIEA